MPESIARNAVEAFPGGQYSLVQSGLTCGVLVVDDDLDTLEEHAEIIVGMGYAVTTAQAAGEALSLISDNPGIGIVMTDLNMPGMDGMSFLDHLMARFGFIRPIVPIVVTGFGTLDTAVKAMRLQAVDLLAKPVAPDELAASLRRGSQRWAQMVGQLQLAGASARSQVRGSESTKEPAAAEERPSAIRGVAHLKAVLRTLSKSRATRSAEFKTKLFADPAWDILLELASARVAGKPVPVFSACAAAGVPTSTALRWVRLLVEQGLIRRWTDPSDRRRDLVELTEETMEAMVRYIGKAAEDLVAIDAT
jgi:CheY-like chemotaxis protein